MKLEKNQLNLLSFAKLLAFTRQFTLTETWLQPHLNPWFSLTPIPVERVGATLVVEIDSMERQHK